MEKASPRSLYHSIFLAELLFFNRILSWFIITLQEFSLRCFSFLHSYVELFTLSPAVHEDHLMKNTPSQPRGDVYLSREDVEMVMGRMGLCNCSLEDDDQLGCMGSDHEISSVFEEEPSLEEVKEAFCVFDENSDGFIDAVELQRILSKLGFREGSDFDSCKRMIVAYDENKDGRIDFNEFVKFMEISFC